MGSFPDLDICWRAAATDATEPFTGPVLRSRGLSGGLAPGQVSAYFPLAAGTYDLRAVAGGAADCAMPLAIFTRATLSAIGPDEYKTLVVMGEIGRSLFRVLELVDERPGATKVRLVSTTLPSPTLGIGLGTGASFAPWITGVPMNSIGSPPQTDVNGYADVEPVSGETLTVIVGTGGVELMHVPDFRLGAGEVVSFFARGFPGPGIGSFRLITCRDGEDDAAPLAPCSVAPQ